MTTPSTIAELQNQLEVDLGLGHKFMHGTDTETILTANGELPTLANILKNLPFPSGGGSAPETLVVSMYESDASHPNLGSFETSELQGSVMLASQDAEWDDVNHRIRFVNPGVFKVTLTSRVTPIDYAGTPQMWPSGFSHLLSASLSPSGGAGEGSHLRVNPAASYDVVAEQWTDEFIIDTVLTEITYTKPTVTCKVPTGAEVAPWLDPEQAMASWMAKFSMVATVVRIGSSPA